MAQPTHGITIRISVEDNQKLEALKLKDIYPKEVFLKGLNELYQSAIDK